jgi:hypothetical protein
MRGSKESYSIQSSANKKTSHYRTVKSGASKAHKLGLISLGTFALIVAPLFVLVMSARANKAINKDAAAQVGFSSSINGAEITGHSSEVTKVPTAGGSNDGGSVNVNFKSNTTSSSDPANNSSSSSLTVNGQQVPTNNSGTVEKKIHSSGTNASVNVSIDNYSTGNSGDPESGL